MYFCFVEQYCILILILAKKTLPSRPVQCSADWNPFIHWGAKQENFYLKFPGKKKLTSSSSDVNRPELLHPSRPTFDKAVQEGENVNFFTLSRPRQNYTAKCLASFRLSLELQTFFNFMFIKTSLSLVFTLWSLQRPPNCIWPWDDCETRTPDMAMTLMFVNISSWNQIEQLFLPAPPPSLSPLRNLGYAGRSWTVWNTR